VERHALDWAVHNKRAEAEAYLREVMGKRMRG
jgi:hypothetical protein